MFTRPEVLSRLLVLALCSGALSACGSGTPASRPSSRAAAGAPASPSAHPHAIEPTAGMQASSVPPPSTGAPSSPSTGDPNAHAPPLSQVRHELTELNLCGGTTNPANAAPIAAGSGPGFVPDPGTQQTEGQLPEITADLNALGKALGVTIYGISGYRSPAQSVAVGGFANDPHTKGEAEDIGVNSLLRSSAAQISEAELARFGLYRPFDPTDDPNNSEVNHVQLIPSGGPPSLAQVDTTFDPDPSCR